jgi:hypothetical protein
MPGGFGIDEEIGIGGVTDRFAHRRQTLGELRGGQFKLTDENAPRSRDLEAGL